MEFPGVRTWWKGDMIGRPGDVLDTFRTCIASGQGDPMAVDGNNERTTFYHHNGTVEQLKYLLDQDVFFIDFFGYSTDGPCVLNEIHRLRLDFFELVHSRICSALENLPCREDQWFETRHLRSIVEMAWNTVSDDATKLLRLTDMTKRMVLSGSDIHGLDFISSRHRPNTTNVTHLFSLVLGSSEGARFILSQDVSKPEEHRGSVAVIQAWLVGLWEADVDLEKYLKEEERLAGVRKASDELIPWGSHEMIRPSYDLYFTYGKYPSDCSVTYKTAVRYRQDGPTESSMDESLGV